MVVKGTKKAPKDDSPVLVADWVPPFPDYVRYLHRSAIDTHSADEYVKGHIAGFKITAQDQACCPSLEGVTMIYLVYKERPNGDPRIL